MHAMRAKMQVQSVEKFTNTEKLNMVCVGKSGSYPADGADEDNTFAKFSPSGSLTLQVANPDLFGKFKPGQKFYVDFHEATT